MPVSRTAKRAALTVVWLLFAAAASAFAYKVGQRSVWNTWCCGLESRRDNLRVSVAELLHLTRWYGQSGQDKWVAEVVFPRERHGFFVDVGSADGTHNSNTKALEERGWTGICIDPFPKHMEGRTCSMVRGVIYSRSGERVRFESPGGTEDEGGAGSIVSTPTPNVPFAEFTTMSLTDVLAQQHAPRYINYISMDIEGAEFEALRGFPADTYRVGAWTIEHNYETAKRAAIRGWMVQHGYAFAHTWLQDDYYVDARRSR